MKPKKHVKALYICKEETVKLLLDSLTDPQTSCLSYYPSVDRTFPVRESRVYR